jgi:hypothetical protein
MFRALVHQVDRRRPSSNHVSRLWLERYRFFVSRIRVNRLHRVVKINCVSFEHLKLICFNSSSPRISAASTYGIQACATVVRVRYGESSSKLAAAGGAGNCGGMAAGTVRSSGSLPSQRAVPPQAQTYDIAACVNAVLRQFRQIHPVCTYPTSARRSCLRWVLRLAIAAERSFASRTFL